MNWKLKVTGYGKIKSTEIEMAPLTLFVGDNNSGKSYLMSLLWGIKNLGIQTLIGRKIMPQTESDQTLFEWITDQIDTAMQKGSHTVLIGETVDAVQSVLQERLNQNKEEIVRKIFNSSDIKIEKLQIEFIDSDEFSLNFIFKEERGLLYLFTESGDRFIIRTSVGKINSKQLSEDFYAAVLEAILSLMLRVEPNDISVLNRDIYLPAARTGFMLTKDVINKVGRKRTFNVEIEREEITPFIRPINQFLDVMSDLSFDQEGDPDFEKIVEYLENGMAEGTIEVSTLPGHEVSYVPSGREKGMPLRIVSAVVTEISPLILILKHNKNLNSLFYEEPEMCLHPHLQQKMGKVICQLVNAPLNMVITTHSDIILQHINNMIRLPNREDAEEICRQYGYTKKDFLSPEQVKVYQFKAKTGGSTEVEEIVCGENGFANQS